MGMELPGVTTLLRRQNVPIELVPQISEPTANWDDAES